MAKAGWVVILFFALSALVVACGRDRTTYGDLPDYAFRSEAALSGYKTAVKHRALLTRLPCYCGCGLEPRYMSLADCFFDSDSGYNAHAANCAVCLEEAEDAALWYGQGMSLSEVRQGIDQKYQERGPSTRTPPITLGEEVAQ